MRLDHAERIAGRIVGALREWCDRIEIAGSIRRRRPHVGDIDLVVLARDGQEQRIRDRMLQSCRRVVCGDQAMVVAMPVPAGCPHPANELQIDVWFAKRSTGDLFEVAASAHNFGTLLLCRTGSKEHNIRLCTRARDMGIKWDPHHGVMRGNRVVASEEEADVFRALDLPFIAPESREAGVRFPTIIPTEP